MMLLVHELGDRVLVCHLCLPLSGLDRLKLQWRLHDWTADGRADIERRMERKDGYFLAGQYFSIDFRLLASASTSFSLALCLHFMAATITP